MSIGRVRRSQAVLATVTLVVVSVLLALAAPSVEAAPSAWFASPSRNIGCYMTVAVVRCDVVEHSYTPPPKPASCVFAWGPSLEIGLSGKGRFRCVSDTVAGSSRILTYGRSLTIGRFRCVSRTSGMTCVDMHDGHGFVLSRASYRLF